MDWFDNHRMLTMGIFLLIIWFSILGFLYLKADEITKDPCSICAKGHGDKVICTIGGTIPVSRIYNPNGSIVDIKPEVRDIYNGPNLGKIFDIKG